MGEKVKEARTAKGGRERCSIEGKGMDNSLLI